MTFKNDKVFKISVISVLSLGILGIVITIIVMATKKKGSGPNPGTGPGVSPGRGPGVSPGRGPGVSPGSGPGVSPGSGPGVSPGRGPGVSPSPQPIDEGCNNISNCNLSTGYCQYQDKTPAPLGCIPKTPGTNPIDFRDVCNSVNGGNPVFNYSGYCNPQDSWSCDYNSKLDLNSYCQAKYKTNSRPTNGQRCNNWGPFDWYCQ